MSSSSQENQNQQASTEMSQSDLRERRRAKILASKDARMARITNVHNSTDSGSSASSIKVDEHILQEFIADSKKHAVELAKADYELTHREHEEEADELLNSSEIKEKQKAQLQSQLSKLHATTNTQILSNFMTLIAALSAAFFFLQRSTSSSLNFCFNSPGSLSSQEIENCQIGLLPILLQIIPGTFVISLLPIISDVFTRRRPIISIIFSIIPTTLLFLVLFLIFFRLLSAIMTYY